LQSFFDECVTKGGSRSLFKVVNLSTSLLDDQIAEFSLSKQINVSYISTYNQSLLQDVQNNQAVFTGLNATSFIDSAGVITGTQALSAIQNIPACGSRTFIVSKAYECLSVCTGAAVANCNVAAAFGFIVVSSQVINQSNAVVLADIEVMNKTVNNIVPTINQADALVKTALSSLSSGFANFDKCDWIGKSFVTIRKSLCGGVADTLNVIWLCCGVLGFVLMYLPIFIVKAEKRFKRNKKDASEQSEQHGPQSTKTPSQSSGRDHELSLSHVQATGTAAAASSGAAASADHHVFVEMPQNL
jgi:hypothetical protein